MLSVLLAITLRLTVTIAPARIHTHHPTGTGPTDPGAQTLGPDLLVIFVLHNRVCTVGAFNRHCQCLRLDLH